jgi:hypothetical protein
MKLVVKVALGVLVFATIVLSVIALILHFKVANDAGSIVDPDKYEPYIPVYVDFPEFNDTDIENIDQLIESLKSKQVLAL